MLEKSMSVDRKYSLSSTGLVGEFSTVFHDQWKNSLGPLVDLVNSWHVIYTYEFEFHASTYTGSETKQMFGSTLSCGASIDIASARTYRISHTGS